MTVSIIILFQTKLTFETQISLPVVHKNKNISQNYATDNSKLRNHAVMTRSTRKIFVSGIERFPNIYFTTFYR
jgi:hypothetical protein